MTAEAIRERLTSRGAVKIGLSRKWNGSVYIPSQLWGFKNGSAWHLIEYRTGDGELLRSSRTYRPPMSEGQRNAQRRRAGKKRAAQPGSKGRIASL